MPERDYMMLVITGLNAKKEKLYANDHKRGFEDIPLHYSFHRLLEEVEELKAEFMKRSEIGIDPRTNYAALRAEFADIGIFADMGILECDRKLARGSQ